jgi:hypothetical protein
MKMPNTLFVWWASAATSLAQGLFIASVEPVTSLPDNGGWPASAEFSLADSSLKFSIRFGLENVVPSVARLVGSSGEFSFELGPPMVVIHSPGPWPDGYDGSTTFTGSMVLPETLQADLARGTVDLYLSGSAVGDFHGFVLPYEVTRPIIAPVERSGRFLEFHFSAEPTYLYTLEYADSPADRIWSSITNYLAEPPTAAAKVIFSDVITSTGARFYRIRKQNAASGVLGQVFIYGCPVIRPGVICEHPYATTITIKTPDGSLIGTVTTDAAGHFKQLLKPGSYVLIPDGAGEPRLPSVEPVNIQVWRRQLTTTVITYDSGIR